MPARDSKATKRQKPRAVLRSEHEKRWASALDGTSYADRECARLRDERLTRSLREFLASQLREENNHVKRAS